MARSGWGVGTPAAACRRLGLALTFVVLLFGAGLVLLPFAFMLLTALKPAGELFTPRFHWLPSRWAWENFALAWRAAPFGRYFLNSFAVAGATTLLDLLLAIPAAYAFAKLRFPGRRVLFLLWLGTMMVPAEMTLIPNYLTLASLHWLDTYYALIIPWIAGAFVLFLLRQHFATLPDELYEAAALDGCGRLRFLAAVAVPLSGPVLATAALLKFIAGWNAFLWVIVVTNSPALRTVPVGLNSLMGEAGTPWNLLMAASVMACLPLLALFLVAQRRLMEGVARAGLRE